jgi:hypothetical protein
MLQITNMETVTIFDNIKVQVLEKVCYGSGGSSPASPEFAPGSVHVGFVTDKAELGQGFCLSFSVFLCHYHFTVAPYSILCGMNNRPVIDGSSEIVSK